MTTQKPEEKKIPVSAEELEIEQFKADAVIANAEITRILDERNLVLDVKMILPDMDVRINFARRPQVAVPELVKTTDEVKAA